MAQKTVITLEDDLDGGDAAETVSFSLDGTSYEIDLNEGNAETLREVLAPWVGHARKAGRPGGGSRRSPAGSSARRGASTDTADIRAWAKANGHKVNERGRIPAAVSDAYRAAQ